MRSALFYGPGDLRLQEVDTPQAGEGEVLVRITLALTCGTDAKIYQRGHPVMFKELPAPFGHEFVGRIAEMGPGAGFDADGNPLREGQRVACANTAPCDDCFYCKRGLYSMCEDLIWLNGAYAEYLVIPERIVRKNLYSVPDDVSDIEAALLEPLACVVHGIENSGICLGDVVAINGAGPIGLLYVAIASLKGAQVIVCDPSPARLEVARRLGAHAVIDPSAVDDQVEAVKDLTEGRRGVDVAIEAVGLPEVWERTIRMVRKGGVANLFGGCKGGTKFQAPTELVHYSQVTVKGVFHHTPQHVKAAMRLLNAHRIDANSLVTHEVPLERILEALNMVIGHQGIKIAVIP